MIKLLQNSQMCYRIDVLLILCHYKIDCNDRWHQTPCLRKLERLMHFNCNSFTVSMSHQAHHHTASGAPQMHFNLWTCTDDKCYRVYAYISECYLEENQSSMTVIVNLVALLAMLARCKECRSAVHTAHLDVLTTRNCFSSAAWTWQLQHLYKYFNYTWNIFLQNVTKLF